MVIIDYDKSSPLDISSTNFYKLTNDSTSRIESDVINQFKPKGCHNRKVFLLVALFAAALSLSVLMMLGSQTNALAQSQNQSNASGQKGQFFADLTGQGVTPPRTTNATGKATFAVTDGANKMSYSVKADIDKVTDVFLSASSGGRYNDLVALRSSVKDGVTGPIKGTLVEGTFSPSDFTSLLRGKQMSDLIKMILDGKVYVRVQTLSAPLGEIQGKVQPAGPPAPQGPLPTNGTVPTNATLPTNGTTPTNGTGTASTNNTNPTPPSNNTSTNSTG